MFLIFILYLFFYSIEYVIEVYILIKILTIIENSRQQY